MKKHLKTPALLTALAVMMVMFALLSGATEPKEEEKQGMLLNNQATFTLGGKPLSKKLLDGRAGSYLELEEEEIVITSKEEIGGIYIKFDFDPPAWKMRYLEEERICGEFSFLHEYQQIKEEGVKELTLCFDMNTSISDIYLLSKGEVPDFVQIWRPAEGRADLLVAVSHSDDDQLFFAGSIPDAVARGAEVQVCYFTNHWKSHYRPHELLDGLYTCGVDRYPVIGTLPDVRSMSLEEALEVWRPYGVSYDSFVESRVELLRRFKPQIVLGHDVNGEYGHGAHILDSYTLQDAVLAASDPERYPGSAEEFGVWDVPKTYLHLWGKNKIDFEIDKPIDFFGGKTAFEVSQDAFRCHWTQSQSRYAQWLFGTEENPVTNSREFPMYSPRQYGLWRSTVGKDTVKTDFYENITLYHNQTGFKRPTIEIPYALPIMTVIAAVSIFGNVVTVTLLVRKKGK